ncbi:hypothetical protein ACFYU9_25655 [Streptomyces sp. NPDC004327]|uniref:hypothetical protein n=1 Tax=Streptomyces sp. NPDC004327 TaxID=3364699 RepID=UPI0036766C0E
MVIVSDWIASQEHVVAGQQRAARSGAGLCTSAGLKAHALRMERLAPRLLEDAEWDAWRSRTAGSTICSRVSTVHVRCS